ncbi:PRAME family member 3-like [Octodon degus]|uniref:PRAME family member 3-like n=1 Tax=Octodon degus TaxID=10160 RepID=A0A6P6E3W3_OCTDE|nr:PRAME family member 3-like [Octodon degus]
MSTKSPRVLLELAIESLVRDEELAIEATKALPGEVFPPVFMEAFLRGRAEVMKAMVLSGPFPSLPLGALRSLREQESLHPNWLDELDALLSQKVCSRRLKLQVLGMRDTPQNFWRVWARNELEACSSGAMKRTKIEKTGTREPDEKALSVLSDLRISHECPCPVASYLFKWIQEERSGAAGTPEPLRVLLDNISTTLIVLCLENSGITGAQVGAFLPSLRCRSQLTTFCFISNFMAIEPAEPHCQAEQLHPGAVLSSSGGTEPQFSAAEAVGGFLAGSKHGESPT